MGNRRYLQLICFFILGANWFACGGSDSSRTVIRKMVAGYALEMRFQSLESIAERTGIDNKEFNDEYTFILSLESLSDNPPLYTGVSSLEEFKQRHEELAFSAASQFYIREGDVERPAAHVHLEHDHGLTPTLTYYIVFDQIPQASEVDIFFNDEYFGLGIHRFRFKRSDINNNT